MRDTDQRSLLFNMIAPPVLTSSQVTDMYTNFERSFANHQNWLRNQIKLFGEQWLSSECGQAWKQHIADVDWLHRDRRRATLFLTMLFEVSIGKYFCNMWYMWTFADCL